ncbi:isoprenylcysteine carboxylmethyltransferase family protein [Saccharopolyspora hirsuta]|uniref:Isoprenylcysteine carboxylmethyltransferase family protein n=1 Tax=Saccharopolyspora hirsuta TaxID=1837 RepID=A0A5M7C1G6_SACHI|nr:isoprenylcysteine carboxylmethyltransferase family protein [Saccharopolyspora hirsuta]
MVTAQRLLAEKYQLEHATLQIETAEAATRCPQLSWGTSLVTTGSFGLVRNPIFTAMIAAVAGLSLMVPNWLQLLGFACLVAAVEIQVRLVEEPHLARIHGAAYAAYAARVGRFLPGIGRAAVVRAGRRCSAATSAG